MKTYKLNDLTIGSKIFIVHKNYAYSKKPGGRVNQGRVVAFINQGGKLKLEFKIVGYPKVLNEDYYHVFGNIKQAIQSIKS